jgi:hypothetical protein
MSKEEAVSYHSRRATHELDLGLTAESGTAARAHLQLASMHMERVRELTGASPPALGIAD